MSTRSRIGIMREDGTVESIYCHYDGYLEGVGKTLNEYYQYEKKVNKLMKLGDISILGPDIGQKQDFDDYENRNKDWCLAYGRDRGEKGVKSHISASKYDFIELCRDSNANYYYLYQDNKWTVYMPKFVSLENALKEIQNENSD